jgi:anaerobic magnesium-protoporphyrin IX monomethyl ester cyclase
MNARRVFLLRLVPVALWKVAHPVHCYPPLSLKYIQKLLSKKKEVFTELFDNRIKNWPEQTVKKYIIRQSPDVLVISSNFTSPAYLLSFCRQLKSVLKKTVILVIGPVVTYNKKKILFKNSPIDLALGGEAEVETADFITRFNSDSYKLDALFQDFNNRPIASLANLDSLPFLDFSPRDFLYYPFIYPLRIYKKVNTAYMEASRGCRHRCIFCSQYIRKSYTANLRFKTPRRIIEEMRHLTSKGANFISFEDDNFSSSRRHLLNVCTEIKKAGLKVKWAAQVRVDEVDKEILQEMKEANCEFLQFGVESASSRLLTLLKKTDSPYEWPKKCKDVFKLCREIGISTCALFIIGIPTETKQDFRQTVDLALNLNPDLVKIHFFYFYPGSKAKKTFNKKLEKQQTSSFIYHHNFPKNNLSCIPSQELVVMRKKFYKRLLLNRRFILNQIRKYALYYFYNWRNFKFLFSKTFKFLLKA